MIIEELRGRARVDHRRAADEGARRGRGAAAGRRSAARVARIARRSALPVQHAELDRGARARESRGGRTRHRTAGVADALVARSRRLALVTLDEELAIGPELSGDRTRALRRSPALPDRRRCAGARRRSVPRLSLQTLVENSVKYAVSPSRDGATIVVTCAAASNDRLQVDVEDDGPGFDASQLPDGHGLQLLQSRLAMTFGDRARCSRRQPARPDCRHARPAARNGAAASSAASRDLPDVPKDSRCLLIRAYVVDDERLAVQRLTPAARATPDVSPSPAAQHRSRRRRSPRCATRTSTSCFSTSRCRDDGFELIEQLDRDIPVVFTTAYDRYALEAFAVNSIDYLLKPVETERLSKALDKLERFSSTAGGRPTFARSREQLARELAPGRQPRADRVARRRAHDGPRRRADHALLREGQADVCGLGRPRARRSTSRWPSSRRTSMRGASSASIGRPSSTSRSCRSSTRAWTACWSG